MVQVLRFVAVVVDLFGLRARPDAYDMMETHGREDPPQKSS
jgi:hypothetical protein